VSPSDAESTESRTHVSTASPLQKRGLRYSPARGPLGGFRSAAAWIGPSVLLALLAGAAAAGPTAPRSPGDAIRDLGVELERSKLPNSSAAAWELAGVRAHDMGEEDAARGLWQASIERDPSRWSAALRLARSYGASRPGKAAQWLVRGAQAWGGSFRHQYAAVVNTLLLSLTALLVSMLVVGTIWTLQNVRLLYHGLHEALRWSLPGSVAAVGAGLVLLLPLAANMGFLVALAVPVALSVLILRENPKRGAILFAVGALASPLLLSWLAHLAAPVDPTHPLALAERAQREPREPHLRRVLDEALRTDPGDPLLRFARSWSALESDDATTADADLAFLDARGGLHRSKVLVNRAALDIRRGAPEEALARLWEARRMAPSMASIAYNAALAHADRMDLERSGDELRRAQIYDWERVREADRMRAIRGHPVPMMENLSRAELWESALRFRWKTRGLPLPMPLALLYPAGNPWLLWPGALVVALVVALLRPRLRNLRPRPCSRCRRPVCRRCVVRVGFRGLCWACAATVRSRGQGWEDQVVVGRFLMASSAGSRRGAAVRTVSGILVPGLPQLLVGQNSKGFGYLFTASALLLLLIQGGPPLPGLGGGLTAGAQAAGAIVPSLATALLFMCLGLSSARHASLHAGRQRMVARWIGPGNRKAA